jgi:ribosomal protein S6--L-glutamate ligase
MQIPVVNPSNAILLSKDKVAAHQILVAHGIPIPRTMACRDSTQVPSIIEALGGPPVIIKVTRGTHGAGVVVAESQASAASILDTIWSFQGEALVQEYVKESDGEDIRVFVVGDRAVGAMKRRAADGDFRANLHLGGTSEVIQLTDELRDLAVQTAAILGLHVAGVDILLSDRGPLVLEANASPGLQGIESTTRLDIARHIIVLAESIMGAKAEVADRIGNI